MENNDRTKFFDELSALIGKDFSFFKNMLGAISADDEERIKWLKIDGRFKYFTTRPGTLHLV